MKKISCMILVVLMVAALSASMTYAQDNNQDDIYSAVEKTNLKIESEIDIAVMRAEKLVDRLSEELEALESVSDNDKEKVQLIQSTIDKINEDIDSIIEKLIEKTENTSDHLVVKAARQGITIIKEYTEVIIGDRTVLVDPSRVSGD